MKNKKLNKKIKNLYELSLQQSELNTIYGNKIVDLELSHELTILNNKNLVHDLVKTLTVLDKRLSDLELEKKYEIHF